MKVSSAAELQESLFLSAAAEAEIFLVVCCCRSRSLAVVNDGWLSLKVLLSFRTTAAANCGGTGSVGLVTV